MSGKKLVSRFNMVIPAMKATPQPPVGAMLGQRGLKLMEFCKLESKSEMVKFVLCDGAFDGAGKEDCINGKCSCGVKNGKKLDSGCGFKILWSEGLRKHVVDKDGNVMASAPKEFQSEVGSQ